MKLTRKSYKRKIVALGVAVFISFSLIATGFASWVLSKSAEKSVEDNITVGTTEESAITISDISFQNGIKEFSFEPKEDDTVGRVRNDGENFENLKVVVTCTIGNISVVDEISVTFELPLGIQQAITDGYITAPAIVATPVTIDNPTAPSTGDYWKYTPTENDATLEVTIEFGWGETFGNMNPGYYYDTEGEGKEIEYEDVKKTLDTFKAVMYGLTYDEYIGLDEVEIGNLVAPKYKVTVSATA